MHFHISFAATSIYYSIFMLSSTSQLAFCFQHSSKAGCCKWIMNEVLLSAVDQRKLKAIALQLERNFRCFMSSVCFLNKQPPKQRRFRCRRKAVEIKFYCFASRVVFILPELRSLPPALCLSLLPSSPLRTIKILCMMFVHFYGNSVLLKSFQSEIYGAVKLPYLLRCKVPQTFVVVAPSACNSFRQNKTSAHAKHI